LLLARLFARPANVLVLDEPTNDLDIDTLELLEELLQDYEGTVFLVSHDRAFMDNVVTSIIACEATDDKPGFWREYEGSVQDWLTQSQRSQAIQAQNKTAAAKQALAAPAATPQTAPAKTSAATTTAHESAAATVTHTSAKNSKAQTSSASPAKSNLKLSYKEQRELDALPGQIEALENEQKQIRLTLEDSSLFAKDPAQATALYARDAEIDAALMAALERWEQLSA
jgi:ATP-binding cassette subfamily F protein uup